MSKKLLERVLLDGVTATDLGSWVDVTSWERLTFQVKGITDATVQLMGSCEPTKPGDSANGPTLCTDLTADGLFSTSAKLKWVKAKVSASTSGTIYTYLVGSSTVYGL